jgi:uncharacterized protein YdhG (YjbR/CyaY superfamily)
MQKRPMPRGTIRKRRSTPKNFADYLKSADQPARIALTKLREIIRSAVPAEASETISYRIPAFRYRNRVLLWFAAFSDHCSLFPTASIIEAFRKQLSRFSKSKGTIHFPLGKPLPVTLIRRMVKARVKQLENAKRRTS